VLLEQYSFVLSICLVKTHRFVANTHLYIVMESKELKMNNRGKCMYNVILWHIHISIVAMEMQLCSLCIVEVHTLLSATNIETIARHTQT